ncbi:hypothetical protein JCM6882_002248 [Rhodosporidiobolus microsporus]
MHHPSTSSLAVALVASAALLASSAEALPTHRSTSSIARRAHLASHSHNINLPRGSTSGTATHTQLGDHSIVVDASTASANGNGGIKNSTINLTSISRREAASSSTFSSFARVVRSLFGASSSTSSSSPAPALPLTVASPRAARSHKKKRRAQHQQQTPSHVRRLPLSQRSIALAGAKAPRSALAGATRSHEARAAANGGKVHQHARNVKQKRRAPSPSQAVEPRAITYDAAAAQASAYHAAVAALGDSQPQLATASPVVNAALASPSANAAAYSGLAGLDLSAAAAASSPVVGSDADTADTTPAADAADLPPVTMTIVQTVTLVPSGLGGAYVDAAGLSTPFPAVATASAAADGETVGNPKASSSPSASPSPSASASSSASTDEQEQPLSTLVLPLSPSSAPIASPSAPSPSASGMARRVRRGITAERRARKVVSGGGKVGGSKVTWYHAPAH